MLCLTHEIPDTLEQLDAIFTLSPDGFVAFDSDGRMTYAATAFARLTGLTAADFTGLDEAGFLARLLVELREPAGRTLQIRLQQGHGSVRQVLLLLRDATHEADVEPLTGERFYRADKSGNIQGTGPGISIIKEIVELMGGSMHLDNEPGRGPAVTLGPQAA